MSNMSYCRFQNTLGDLEDCAEDFANKLSREEHRARKKMLDKMVDIFDELGIRIDREDLDAAIERIDAAQAAADDSEDEEG